MTISPWRLLRRRRHIARLALEEAWRLRRRHGDAALVAAHEKLARPDLTRWGRDVLREAVRQLRSRKNEGGSPFGHGHAPVLFTGPVSNDPGVAAPRRAPSEIARAGTDAGGAEAQPGGRSTSPRAGRGLGPPALAISPPSEPGRLFIVSQRAKRVHILNIDGGAVAPTPFLALSEDRPTDEEYRLLGIAFHPDYALNGCFFVYLIDEAGTVEVREYTRINADHADPFSARTVMWFHHPFARAGAPRDGPAQETALTAWADGDVPEIAATSLTFDGRGQLYAIGPNGEVRRLKIHEVVGGPRFETGMASTGSIGRAGRGFHGGA
jgi:hypothetical protein